VLFTKLKKYWHLFWLFRKLRFMALLEYRGNFIFWSIVSIMWTVFNFFFFSLILNVKGSIAGWSKAEMYLLLSTFTILDAFTWSFFYHNMREFSSSIFSGELSQHLTKPVDTQYILSVQTNSYNNVPRFIIGVVGVVWSLQQLNLPPTGWNLLLYIISICSAMLFLYGSWFFLACLSFWVEKLDNINEIIPSTRRAWQVPREVYTGFASTLFTVAVPLGLVASVPSEILLGRSNGWWPLYLFCFGVVTCIFARLFFLFSLRKFSSVGN
jgi:ABC-2 type transport system permease protein